ncbi:MAG: NTP transferase domain-containing protein, partial [Thermoanaerobaculia bacterium]
MISAIVLAAGESKRFGSAKQLARVGDKLLLQHTLDNLAASRVDDIVVVLGANAEAIRREIQFGRARVVSNPDYADGMSTSIHAGLRAIDAEAAMIVLGDEPYVRPETLNALIDEYRRTHAKIIAPTYNGFRGNPVIVDRSLFDEMMTIRGDIGCRAIFGNHEVTKIAVDDRGVIMDVDTPGVILSREDGEGSGRGLEGSHPPDPSPRLGMTQTRDLLETIVDLRRRRQPFAMATVVRAERPTSSKPGDKAIIAPDGTLTGWIGGSCAHDIVVRNALQSREEGAPRLLTLSATMPVGAHRHGVIDIPMQCYSGGVLDVFIEPSLPRPHMIVVGYETIARALVRISKTLEFHVTVVDPLATRASVPEADEVINELRLPEMSGETFVVVATHGRYDEEALEQAARTNASYVALVASPKRSKVILDVLRDRGVNVANVKSPAGLDIGAQGAEEIALSIVAEIVQLRRAAARNAAEAGGATQKQMEKPTEAIDPICQMTVTIADAKFTTERDGVR